MPFLLLLLVALLGAACNDGDVDPALATEQDDAAPPAVYERRLVFLTGEQEPPLSALLDFVVAAGGRDLHRSARGWIREDTDWHDFMDLDWRMEPMREPWRVVPHGPLRVIIADDDDIEAVIHRGESELRLMPGPDIAGWIPHPAGQLRLRRSRLRVDGREVPGMLLDAQFVHRAIPGAPPGPGTTGDELFLTDGRGLHFVIAANSHTEPFAWLRRGQEERTWSDAEVQWLEPDTAAHGLPTAWRVYAREGGFHGELESLDLQIKRQEGTGAVTSLVAVYAVGGWLDILGERRQVFGVVRHAQE